MCDENIRLSPIVGTADVEKFAQEVQGQIWRRHQIANESRARRRPNEGCPLHGGLSMRHASESIFAVG